MKYRLKTHERKQPPKEVKEQFLEDFFPLIWNRDHLCLHGAIKPNPMAHIYFRALDTVNKNGSKFTAHVLSNERPMRGYGVPVASIWEMNRNLAPATLEHFLTVRRQLLHANGFVFHAEHDKRSNLIGFHVLGLMERRDEAVLACEKLGTTNFYNLKKRRWITCLI